MKTVGVRALKQNASAVVAEAEAGEVITITHRGRPVAQLGPLPVSRLEGLVAAGRARIARRRLTELGPPPAARPGDPSLSEVLGDMRRSERY